MDVYVKGNRIRLTPTKMIGQGGEAEIYEYQGSPNPMAVKVFKQPSHSDFDGNPQQQRAVRARIEEHQRKLPAFPRNLPPRVIVPADLATSSGGEIVGYTMSFLKGAEVLLRYGDRPFREAGVPDEQMQKILTDLHQTVGGIHKAGAVIGDFNDLNVLVIGNESYVIDADSFQFAGFPCRVFTARFVDPLLCDPSSTSMVLAKPHNPDSDWYAFAIMLMNSFLYVGPYGGIYRPKDLKKKIPHDARPLRRITVFHPEVIYPKPARHFKILPDGLLQLLHEVFEKNKRGPFPETVLQSMRWTKCVACGTMHARNVCPECAQAAPAAVREVTEVRGKVTSTRFFHTPGIIVFAAFQGGKLCWLYHENGQFKREDNSVIVSSALDPQMRFRISGGATMIARSDRLVTFRPGQDPEQIAVDTFVNLPVFDATHENRYWLSGGMLMRDGKIAPETVGEVLQGQTLFWAGPSFGFGFYRAGNLNVAFVFDAKSRGINDEVKIGKIRGQLIDSTCVFTRERCWFFVSTQESGKTVNRCITVRKDGTVEARAEGEEGDGTWLSTLRGKTAAGNFLLAATDEGIVRVEPAGDRIEVVKEFPDTANFVNSGCHLFPGPKGLYVVSLREIRELQIA